MPLRSPPPIPNIIRPYSRNSQTDQIHLSSLCLQFLRFCNAEVTLFELFLARVMRLGGLIDPICGGKSGDTGETGVKNLLWRWLWLRFLSVFVVRRGVAVAVVASGRAARGALRA